MECVIDTNILVDYMIKGSDMHEKAKEYLEKIDNGVLPSVVLEELVYVLNRIGLDKAIIEEEISEVLNSYEVLGVGGDEIIQAKDIIMQEKHTMFRRFNDKLILSFAKKRDLPLLTFDSGLIEECKTHNVKLFAPGQSE
jgi:predicted nucleic acid-binding protein